MAYTHAHDTSQPSTPPPNASTLMYSDKGKSQHPSYALTLCSFPWPTAAAFSHWWTSLVINRLHNFYNYPATNNCLTFTLTYSSSQGYIHFLLSFCFLVPVWTKLKILRVQRYNILHCKQLMDVGQWLIVNFWIGSHNCQVLEVSSRIENFSKIK